MESVVVALSESELEHAERLGLGLQLNAEQETRF